MANMTNAQAALMAAVEGASEGASVYYIKSQATELLKWLNDNS